jgi:RimJ/RimL family protein N-acetyltransferase
MKRVGAKQEGVCRKSFLKQGELIDEYIYGLCKEDK